MSVTVLSLPCSPDRLRRTENRRGLIYSLVERLILEEHMMLEEILLQRIREGLSGLSSDTRPPEWEGVGERTTRDGKKLVKLVAEDVDGVGLGAHDQ
jgi:hypothetical protein